MRKIYTILAALFCCTMTLPAVEYYGITFGTLEVTSENKEDIFGDGMAEYDPEFNTLFLESGFSYSLSKGFISIDTEQEEFGIRLEGNAEIKAAVKSNRDIRITSDSEYTLSITSNISGSALECPNLIVGSHLTLNLLSRNSQNDMYALDCAGKLEVWGGTLIAEVTTANLAVKVSEMVLDRCSLTKPKGGGINTAWGGICFADGTPAKVVHITPWAQGIDDVQGDKVQSTKVLRDGVLYIERNNTTYNAQGAQIQ